MDGEVGLALPVLASSHISLPVLRLTPLLAIAYSYFETLIRLNDPIHFEAEEARMWSLNNLLNTAGFRQDIYMDFVEETINLLRLISESISSPHNPAHGRSVLLDKFNDPGVSSAIITHFRLLTSAWMKSRPAAYQPFILDGTVEQYCANQIEPYQVEIEHIGMNALIDVVIRPAGFAVEIVYLDRSAGSEVNEHRFEPTRKIDSTNVEPTPLRLLYRP